MNRYNRVVITSGEPSGIGPDIVVKLAQLNWPVELVVCASGDLLKERAKKLNLPLDLREFNFNDIPQPQMKGTLTLLDVPLKSKVIFGQLSKYNSEYVLNTLRLSCDGCINNRFFALITGPVNKFIMNQSGINFLGHTDFFSSYFNIKNIVMVLMNDRFRVALLTNHIPIRKVSSFITEHNLTTVIRIINKNLKYLFNIINPKIWVSSLNPHVGENGFIGDEENKIIIPVLNKLRINEKLRLIGPLSPDTIFCSKYITCSDIILTMYHDQGLPVLKFCGFNKTINISLGLPFIRTSVGHGTALSLAGTGKADPTSFINAIKCAIKIIRNIYE
ncbi:4-hydroxythreonine-4-phosphate dehydrogenase PdxA [Candidatus Purcelliella pentastirinorum]|uniref:4-hydroxythreonine-4-phosphate dehydrogenase PdxA n=1 Tax=Candidatus Purcelliella pentastirinorum TaxID=472834 RepID=A0AAX3N9Q0_9ENTR|nr:4-hydroxythreonine-4-phosphate dehydrogenase PdxA [Candidatus Purcelliella pentastirinorum]WDI78660.1 4-hydroxythreonine-4-phosphate dehydrogenase PdxA [Candidatus Purcelliella pentastirinorum]